MKSESDGQKICLITGANGYIGSVIAGLLKQNGWEIRYLVHDKSKTKIEQNVFNYELNEPISEEIWAGVDAAIFCAWDFNHKKYRVNVDGTMLAIKQAMDHRVSRIIFMSTNSAFKNCKSEYGRAKLEVESQLDIKQVLCLKPGLVYGHSGQGILGKLQTLAQRLPVVPMINGGRQHFYPLLDEDLGRLVLEYLDGTSFQANGSHSLAESQKYTLRELVLSGKPKLVFSIPAFLPLMLLYFLNFFGIKFRIGPDSIRNLLDENPAPDASLMQTLDLASFREFRSHDIV